jgi:hypothetical protein
MTPTGEPEDVRAAAIGERKGSGTVPEPVPVPDQVPDDLPVKMPAPVPADVPA